MNRSDHGIVYCGKEAYPLASLLHTELPKFLQPLEKGNLMIGRCALCVSLLLCERKLIQGPSEVET